MMNTVATPHGLLTVDEYLEFEETSPVRHEYVGGRLYAFAGATEDHNLIAGNIFARLWSAARGGPCRLYMSDMKLRVDNDLFYYPDVMAVCDPEDGESLYKTRPSLVVEILSPTTSSIDRREKLLAYRRIPSLQAYVIVYQDEQRVEYHRRDGNDTWRQSEITGDEPVSFPCPSLELSLAEIYEGLSDTPRSS